MSIRVRLTLFATGLVALGLFLFGWLLYTLVANAQITNQDKALEMRAADALAVIRTAPATQLRDSGSAVLIGAEDLRTETDPFVEIVAADGRVLSSTAQMGGAPPSMPASLLEEAARAGSARATTAGPVALRVFARPWERADLGLAGYVVAAQPTSIQVTNLKGIRGFLVISAIPTLLATLAASWLITRLLSRRYESLLRQRDEAYQKLETALAAQRRFVADASHELRTPLTTIRGNAGLLAHRRDVEPTVREAAARDIASETERMSRMVEQLLTLAQADAGQRLQLAPTQLRPILDEICRQAQAAHPDRKFGRTGLTDATVDGDEDALRQLIWILVDNAAKFTSQGGSIELGLQRQDPNAVLTVADDGAGIPQADLNRIFERFYQADTSRSSTGAGLGLAIARWIVEQHNGTILAQNNDGPGATFTVRLPLRP